MVRAKRGSAHRDIRAFWYNLPMGKSRRKKVEERPIFDAIRKPTAPPSQRMGTARPEEKAHPSQRRVKHKKPISGEDS